MKLNRTLVLLAAGIATVAAGAAVAAATTSPAAVTTTAVDGAPRGKHWHHRDHEGGMLVGVMLRAARQLDLTAEQQAAIKDILSAARAQHQAAVGSAPVDLMTLANPGDSNYATALQNAKAAAAARLQNQVELQGRIYNVLTAEQKAKLPQVLADMRSKAERRRVDWQQHGAAAPGAAGSN